MAYSGEKTIWDKLTLIYENMTVMGMMLLVYNFVSS